MRGSGVTRGGQQYGGRGGETGIDPRPEQGTKAQNTADPKKHHQGAGVFPRRWRPARLHHELCLCLLVFDLCASLDPPTPPGERPRPLPRHLWISPALRKGGQRAARRGDAVRIRGKVSQEGTTQRTVNRRSRCARETREINAECLGVCRENGGVARAGEMLELR